MKVPEEYRVKEGMLGSTAGNGNNGMFKVPFESYEFGVVASDGEEFRPILGYKNLCEISTIGRI